MSAEILLHPCHPDYCRTGVHTGGLNKDLRKETIMKVKEANKLIEQIDNEIKNLQKFSALNPEEREEIVENVGLNSPLEKMVCISVNAMLSWKSVLEQRIGNAELDKIR